MGVIDINKRLINNDALFSQMYVVEQKFEIIPQKEHLAASINYIDLQECRDAFLEELYDTIVDWMYSSEKYEDLKNEIMEEKKKGESAAASEIERIARGKFRHSDNEKLVIQGQLGELLLFHFIQKHCRAYPLLRKMKITTSDKMERFGADAIHYKPEGDKNIIYLGEAKVYSSKYKFAEAFENALTSIIDTYTNLRNEMKLYVYEDFLEKDMQKIAKSYLNSTLPNTEIRLVNLILYNETGKRNGKSEKEIKESIRTIIEKRFKDFDNKKVEIDTYPILDRILYIVFPVWELEALALDFARLIG